MSRVPRDASDFRQRPLAKLERFELHCLWSLSPRARSTAFDWQSKPVAAVDFVEIRHAIVGMGIASRCDKKSLAIAKIPGIVVVFTASRSLA